MSGPDATAAPGGRYAFLRTPRWIRLTAAMVVVSLVCVLLGAWQWSRYTARAEQAQRVAAVYDAEPVALAEALASPTGPVTRAEEWQPVRLAGAYVPDAQVLLRNRPVDGTAAVHVAAPFVLSDGTLVVVDRGWLPAGAAEGPRADVPGPPEGEVELVARLRVAEPPAGRESPPGQVYSLDAGEVRAAAADVGAEIPVGPALDGYVAAVAEDPAPAATLGAFQRPTSNHGTNLSYALQWWFFAVASLAAVGILARREAAENAGERPGRGRVEEEDAVVDAQLDRKRPDQDRPDQNRLGDGQARVTSSR